MAHKDEKNKITGEQKDQFRNALASRQIAIRDAGLPVVVLIEGFGAAGKGSALGSIIKFMDPRFFKVYNMDVVTEDELRKPFLYRYAAKLPKQGQFAFLDGGWLSDVTKEYLHDDHKKLYKNKVESIRIFERQLRDNGYLVVKFFLDVDRHEQKKRLEHLLSKKDTAFRVTDVDIWENKNYDKCRKTYFKFIEETNTLACPWHIITADDKDAVEYRMASTIVSAIDDAIANPWTAEIQPNRFELTKTVKLADIELKSKVLSEEEYRKRLKECQNKLSSLHNKLYRRNIPVIIAYEGWDAAGKGGNIKRIASALDPRGYEVLPIASPTPEEKARHFLWRFWTRLPRTGHIAIFDRTWYGRVMVERLEGYCSENDWQRAYNEINEFEKELSDWGAIIIKFWVQIDKDTQLERFTLRQNTPEKQWKITDEDWRNREKWDLYESAVNEMIAKTSTEFAPWHILESNDKKYARIKALEIVIDEIEKRL
jgi:polyphosphate:AMP phosphotransferase